MRLAENLLYFLVKLFYKSEVAHTIQMKRSLSDKTAHDAYRHGQLARIIEAAKRYDVELAGKEVLDLGCNDGAITIGYVDHEVKRAVGVDIDARAIARARQSYESGNVCFVLGETESIPLRSESFDVIICFDVFEHVAHPREILDECYRVLRAGGKMLICTWGWRHPFAPHLWATMPVPWAHIFFSEKTILRTCRRVYDSPWYAPTIHDVDENGVKKEDKYLGDEISTDYLNKLLISDFEKIFAATRFRYRVFLCPFGSRYARWTRLFLWMPYVREFITSHIWVLLRKDDPTGRSQAIEKTDSAVAALIGTAPPH